MHMLSKEERDAEKRRKEIEEAVALTEEGLYEALKGNTIRVR